MFYFKYGKRIFDLALAIPGLLSLAPILLVFSLLVRTRLGRPMRFKQIRPRLHGKPFAIYKFRKNRDACLAKVIELARDQTQYLRESGRRKPEVALRKVNGLVALAFQIKFLG